MRNQRSPHTSDNHLHLPLINRQRWQQPYRLAPRDVDQQAMILAAIKVRSRTGCFSSIPIIKP